MKHFEIFTGRVGVVEEIKELANGNCVVNFSVAETPRIKKGNDWVDGTTIWTNIAIFGDEARNLHRSVKPGTPVVVIGTRQAREYTIKDTNERKVTQSVVAEQVAVAITKFNYIEGVGNVNHAKDNTGGTTQSKPMAGKDPFNSAPVASDPLVESSFNDPFGNDDEDPFGLNS